MRTVQSFFEGCRAASSLGNAAAVPACVDFLPPPPPPQHVPCQFLKNLFKNARFAGGLSGLTAVSSVVFVLSVTLVSVVLSSTVLSCGGGGSSTGGDHDGGNPGVSGRVVSGMTGKVVTGTVVTLKKNGTAIASATAGTDGSYSFTGIEAGSGYTVAASASIYDVTPTAAFTVSGHQSGVDIMMERKWPADATLVAGTPGNNSGNSNSFIYPVAMAFSQDGTLYVSDYYNYKIRTVTPGNPTITDYAGTGDNGWLDGSPPTSARFSRMIGLCFGPDGALYVADCIGQRVRKISGNSVATIAGTGFAGSSASGVALNERLYQPYGLAFAGDSLIVTERNGNRIIKITGTNFITIAGDGTSASTGEDGSLATAAQVNYLGGVAAAPDGSIYFAEGELEAGQGGGHKVRKINSSGVISTVTGTGSSGNGTGQLNTPRGIAVDAAGSVYISDTGNYRILKVRNGTVTKLYGSTRGSATGQLAGAEGLAIGPDGYLYIADSDSYRILKY